VPALDAAVRLELRLIVGSQLEVVQTQVCRTPGRSADDRGAVEDRDEREGLELKGHLKEAQCRA
jgi:hypothetical protein